MAGQGTVQCRQDTGLLYHSWSCTSKPQGCKGFSTLFSLKQAPHRVCMLAEKRTCHLKPKQLNWAGKSAAAGGQPQSSSSSSKLSCVPVLKRPMQCSPQLWLLLPHLALFLRSHVSCSAGLSGAQVGSHAHRESRA
jgi:hypothetical protein